MENILITAEQMKEMQEIAEALKEQNLPVIRKIGKKKFAKSSYAAGYNAGLDFMVNQITRIMKGQPLLHLEKLDLPKPKL